MKKMEERAMAYLKSRHTALAGASIDITSEMASFARFELERFINELIMMKMESGSIEYMDIKELLQKYLSE